MASGAHHRETWSSSTEERHLVLSVGNRLQYIITFEKKKAPDTPPPHRYWLSDATGWSQTKMIGMKSRKYLAVMLISFQLYSLFVLSGNKFSVLHRPYVYIRIGLSILSNNLMLQAQTNLPYQRPHIHSRSSIFRIFSLCRVHQHPNVRWLISDNHSNFAYPCKWTSCLAGTEKWKYFLNCQAVHVMERCGHHSKNTALSYMRMLI